PLLEVQRPALAALLHDHVRLDLVVGHRDEPDAWPPPVAQRLGDRGQRVPGGEHLGADDVRGDVPVAQPEPVRLHPVGEQLLLDGERLVVAPPALVLVDPAPEGVHHRVQIRTDAQSEKGDVVTGVPDDGDGGITVLARYDPEGRLEAAQEPRASDTARRYDYPHAPKSGRLRRRVRGRAPEVDGAAVHGVSGVTPVAGRRSRPAPEPPGGRDPGPRPGRSRLSSAESAE